MASGSPSSCVAGFGAALRHVALVGHSRGGGGAPFSAFRAHGAGAAARVEPLQLALDAAARAALDRGVEALDCGSGVGGAGSAAGAPRLLVLAAPCGGSSSSAAVLLDLSPTADGGASLSTLALLARGGGGRAAAATAVALDAQQPRAAVGDASGRVAVHDLSRAGSSAGSTEAWASSLAGGAGPSVAAASFWRTSADVVWAAGGVGGLHIFQGVGAAPAAASGAGGPAAYDTREGRSRPVLRCALPPGGAGASDEAAALSSISCAASHGDDPFAIVGGTDSGDVVLWDVRRTAAAQRVTALHAGPISGIALSPAGDAFTCSEDGDVRAMRCAALGPRREARFHGGGGGAWLAAGGGGGDGGERGSGPRAPHVLSGAGRLSGIAWLQSVEQRAADDRGEGLVVVACESGGIEWRVALAGVGNGEGEADDAEADANDAEEDNGAGLGGDHVGELGEEEEEEAL
jgi:hypothetical protein